jgi:hypothetical protein
MGDDAAFEDASGDVTVTVLIEDGGRVDWGHARDVIAFDRIGDDGYADVFLVNPDGSDERCLSCDVDDLPQKHVGQPAWHPDGDFLVFQAEREDSGDGAGAVYAAHPGRGVKNDLWAMHVDSGEVFKLTDIPNEAGRGTLHAHFNAAGTQLYFSEMLAPADPLQRDLNLGAWQLVRADWIVDDGTPRLENHAAFSPGGRPLFYESHGPTPDDSRWLFSANIDESKGLSFINDIFFVDLPDVGEPTRLTTHAYNEHALMFADSERIMWMSNAGNPERGTDYWSASVSGDELVRLTRFKDSFPDATEETVAADFSFGPVAGRAAAYLQRGAGGGSGRIVILDGLR